MMQIQIVQVCTDCYLAHHGVLEEKPQDVVPLSLLADVETCGVETDNEDDIVTPFSSTPCDGCGQRLAGSRYALGYWEK